MYINSFWCVYIYIHLYTCERRQWHPTPVLLPGKSHGWRSLVGCSPWGREESDPTERLHFHFHFHALDKEMATHSSVLAWRIPGMAEPGGLPCLGSHRVGHDWRDLAVAAAYICELPDVQAGFKKAEEPEIKLSTFAGSSKKWESSIKIYISALLTMPKPLTVWITINCGKFWKRWEYQTTWPASWETYMQVRNQQLELDMEQQTGSK